MLRQRCILNHFTLLFSQQTELILPPQAAPGRGPVIYAIYESIKFYFPQWALEMSHATTWQYAYGHILKNEPHKN